MKKWRGILVSCLMAAIVLLMISSPAMAAKPEGVSWAFLKPPVGVNNDCSGTEQVELWLNTEEDIGGGQVGIEYDCSCINVNDVTFNSTYAGFSTWDSTTDGYELLTFGSLTSQKGMVHVATMTVECNGCNCSTLLEFTDESKLTGPAGASLDFPVMWMYNAFFCGKPLPCLGACYQTDACSDPVLENVPCWVCEELDMYWSPYPTEQCYCNEEDLCPDATQVDPPLCLKACPECSDGMDNDGDELTDQMDPQCYSGIDNTESEDCCQPIPELATFALVGVGLAGMVWFRRRQ